jgi:hypothetical protein
LKADVKLARELLKKGITMTEHRKQLAGGTAKPAKKTPVVAPKTRQSRKSPTVEVVQAPAPAPKAVVEASAKGSKGSKGSKAGTRKVSSPKLPASQTESTGSPLVTPISLEQVAQQHSLFDEPAKTPRATRRTRAMAAPAAPVAPAQAPVVLPQFSATLDPAKLAESLQPFAGALSDMLAQMVLGQAMQKVQQGLGGLSMALAQGVQQPQIPAPSVSPVSPEALLAANRPAEAAAPTVSEQTLHVPAEAAATPSQASAAHQEDSPAATSENEAQAETAVEVEVEAPQVIRRPVLHTPPAPVVQPTQPKILIVGLIPNQAGIINAEFHEAFDIRFAEAETPSKRLEAMADDCDRVIIMANFISHSVQDTLKKHPGFERMHGGLTRVKDRLTELFIASEAAA